MLRPPPPTYIYIYFTLPRLQCLYISTFWNVLLYIHLFFIRLNTMQWTVPSSGDKCWYLPEKSIQLCLRLRFADFLRSLWALARNCEEVNVLLNFWQWEEYLWLDLCWQWALVLTDGRKEELKMWDRWEWSAQQWTLAHWTTLQWREIEKKLSVETQSADTLQCWWQNFWWVLRLYHRANTSDCGTTHRFCYIVCLCWYTTIGTMNWCSQCTF